MPSYYTNADRLTDIRVMVAFAAICAAFYALYKLVEWQKARTR